MKPTGRLNLVADLRDLQLEDADGKYCGIVDDIEFEGKAGGPLVLKALLVGPGTYDRRLPGWAAWLVRHVAGKRIVRVPWREIESIGSVVRLARPARDLGLARDDEKAARLVAKLGGRYHALD